MENGHLIDVNGISCATLGHGFREENVKHDYFGSE